MYINFKDGVKKVKDGAIIYKFFGVLAVIFLIPFIFCNGVAKVIFGVIFSLIVLFMLFTLAISFIERGSKKESEAVRARVEEDVKTYQNAKPEWVKEFCGWYIAWQEHLYGHHKIDPKTPMMLGLNLHICKTDGMSVFEKFQTLYFKGVVVADKDKYELLSLAQQLDKSMKDDERDVIKSKIIGIAAKY